MNAVPESRIAGGALVVPAIIRGELITSDLMEYGGRNGDAAFLSPDPAKLLARLPLGSPTRLNDMHALKTAEVLEFLSDLGAALEVRTNLHLQEALDLTSQTAATTPPLLRNQYNRLPMLFGREQLEDAAHAVGAAYLDGWVEDKTFANGAVRHIRALGARSVHIIAGNSPMVAAMTLIRNAITRGDAVIKAPSNDPFSASAVIRTMIDMAPGHPITKHIAVAYWKGGDEAFESKLYQPHNFEKIVAWGGYASVKHVTKYIQPGIELLSLDPKRSISVIGPEALADDASMEDAAVRLAADFGTMNQEVCANSRIAYVMSGSDDDGLDKLSAFGKVVYQKLLALPERLSTKPRFGINRDLKSHIDAIAPLDDFYEVIGGNDGEGAVIVSRLSEPVDFAPLLTNRVMNLVPVDDLADILPRVDAYCQTIGVYPEQLCDEAGDQLMLAGGQRLVTLGYAATTISGLGSPQDGIEPTRRMCRWVFRETANPAVTPHIWKD